MSASTFLITAPPPIYISGNNVGIGDSSPSVPFDVLGQTFVTAITDGPEAFRVNRADGARSLCVGTFTGDPTIAIVYMGVAVPSGTNYTIFKVTGATIFNDDTAVQIRIGSGFSPVALSVTAAAISVGAVFFPFQAPTASAPAYVNGGMYFDTTLDKLRIGGATGWETVTSV